MGYGLKALLPYLVNKVGFLLYLMVKGYLTVFGNYLARVFI